MIVSHSSTVDDLEDAIAVVHGRISASQETTAASACVLPVGRVSDARAVSVWVTAPSDATSVVWINAKVSNRAAPVLFAERLKIGQENPRPTEFDG